MSYDSSRRPTQWTDLAHGRGRPVERRARCLGTGGRLPEYREGRKIGASCRVVRRTPLRLYVSLCGHRGVFNYITARELVFLLSRALNFHPGPGT